MVKSTYLAVSENKWFHFAFNDIKNKDAKPTKIITKSVLSLQYVHVN